jgi:hypothetical protein
VPDPGSNPPAAHRRWTVIASGLLVSAVALIVIFTGRAAFHSLAAVVVMAAIGLVAVLLQLHLRNASVAVHVPNWLNVVGLLCAVAALFADWLHLGPALAQVMALAAVGCFAVSSFRVLDAIRKARS